MISKFNNGYVRAWFFLFLEFHLLSSVSSLLERCCALCWLTGGSSLAGSWRPRGKSWGSDSLYSFEAISRRGPFQKGQQGVSCSVLWSPCEGPPCLRDAISIQAACHGRERFHLDFWKETSCRGRPPLKPATLCQGRAVPGKPYMQAADGSRGRGAGPR